jgi:chromosome segregation and condensation protein ScpB
MLGLKKMCERESSILSSSNGVSLKNIATLFNIKPYVENKNWILIIVEIENRKGIRKISLRSIRCTVSEAIFRTATFLLVFLMQRNDYLKNSSDVYFNTFLFKIYLI